jgi:chromate transporter
VHAGLLLLRPAWSRTTPEVRWRFIAYVLLGAASAATLGPWLVAVLIACGVVEVAWRRFAGASRGLCVDPFPVLAVVAASGTFASLTWVAFKVGALSYGGGFVIIPLMQADAVERYGWMTETEFLNAVALGQVTPGPVVHTVAVVGYAAAGIPGALLAAAVAFAPSFAFVLAGAERFDRFVANGDVRAFFDGAGPAAIGAILGSAVPLALALQEEWQWAVLAAAGLALFAFRRGVVLTLLAAGAFGAVAVLAGAPV